MLKYAAAFGCSAIVVAVLDGVWLTVMGNKLYRPVLGDWMANKVNLPAAAAFYIIFLVGVTFLATAPALRELSAGRAALNGAVLGFVAYATYDLTNQATLNVWSTRLTIIDLCWGTALTTLSAVGGYLAAKWAEGRFG